jgi:choice-of-anchor A domain-containing protein
LGRGFSEATSDDPSEQAYDGECYPPIVQQLVGDPIVGRDDSIAVFAGKDYIGRKAAEVEGKMVVLGDLKVKKNGPGNFVSVGVGTHVIPNPNTECIIVGGDLEADRDIQVYNQAEWMTCDIIYRGNEKKVEKWKTNGEVIHDPNYDMTYYEDMKDVFIEKSQFWKNLPSTGSIVQQWSETRFECTDSDEIQVFNFVTNQEKEYLSKKSITDFIFSDECEGKSILINVHGSKNIKVNANAMFHKGKMGYQAGGFSTCLTQSILWNFPDAKKVDIGNGKSSEFHGSILTGNPEGELELTTTGHSGRAIVVGTIIHDAGGSEFHSYPYNPPRALPDPAGLCEMNPTIGKFEAGNPNDETTVDIISVGAQTQPPTGSPTASPIAANEAVSGACVHIPQDRLPADSWKTNDEKCATCHVDNLSLSWPCDVSPRLCEGDCWFVGEPLPPHNPEDIEGCEPIKLARLTSGSQTTIEECQRCADGYRYWPCNLDSPICEGRGCGF